MLSADSCQFLSDSKSLCWHRLVPPTLPKVAGTFALGRPMSPSLSILSRLVVDQKFRRTPPGCVEHVRPVDPGFKPGGFSLPLPLRRPKKVLRNLPKMRYFCRRKIALMFGISFIIFSYFRRFVASIWLHVDLFPYFLHAFFQHQFCIDFGLIFDSFLNGSNHVFYSKYHSSVHFRLFRKRIEKHGFRHTCLPPFRFILALIFYTFSASSLVRHCSRQGS